MKEKIVVIMTCYNRKEKTKNCIESVCDPRYEMSYIVADDGSTDGTGEMLQELSDKHDITIISGDGRWYYSGGMRAAMKAVKDSGAVYDYILMVNDDVSFFSGAVDSLVKQSKLLNDAVIVGATRSQSGGLTYGGIKYLNGIKYEVIEPLDGCDKKCDTFNANCVLVPFSVFLDVDIIDSHYIHSGGDFDYGMDIKRHGYSIYSSDDYVGICEWNSPEGTWSDTSLSRIQRLHRKESVKGAPFKQWFYYLRKNFGLFTAITRSVTPFIRILLGK